MPVWMLWIGGFLLLALLVLAGFRLAEARRRPACVQAAVLEKKECGYSQVTVGHYGLLNRSDRLVLFSVEGETLGLFCGEALYDALQKGERGTLTYRAGRVLSFERKD